MCKKFGLDRLTRSWCKGSMPAFQACGPGSSPGERIIFFSSLLPSFHLSPFLFLCRRQEEQSERSKRAAKFEVPDWACSDASTQTSDEEVVDDVILWHCPACEKYFKSSAALNNHERSNKHKERVEILRMELEADDLLEHDSAPDPTAYADTDRMSELSMQQDTEINTKTSSEFIKRSSEFDTDKDISVPATFAHAKQEACPVLVNAHLGDEDLVKEDSVKVASKCSTVSSVSSDEDRTEEDMLADLLKMSALGQLMVEDSSPPASQHFSKNSGLNEEDQIEDLSNEPERKIKKKVSGKRGAKNRWHAKKASSAGMDKYRCEACSNEFTSRNQLFKHIKSTGHAMTKAK
jgi:DnaJ family protein A protein 5